MASVQEAQQAVARAQAALEAKEDKATKKALKEAKKALETAQAKAAAEAAAAPAAKPKKKKAEAPPETPTEEAPKAKKAKKEKGEAPAAAPPAAAETPKAKKQKKAKAEAAAAAAAPAAPAAEAEKPKKKKQKKAEEAAAATPAPAASTDVLSELKSNKRDRPGADGQKKPPAAANTDEPVEASNRVFAGNLSFQIDDDKIKEFFKDCGTISDIKWMEHKDTKRFKGCGILTFDSVESAEKAVAKNGEECMGRPILCQFSKPLSDNKKGNKSTNFVDQPLSEKPEGCTTCFVGNVSFQCEEDDMRAFAADCGTVKNIRWVYHKDTGNFKGCGFVEFEDTAAVDKFVLKNGQDLKGRPLRIDYTKARE